MLDLTMIRKGLYEAKCLLEDRVPARYRGYALNAVEGAMNVLNSNMNFVWHEFRKDSMPVPGNPLIIWLDYQHCGFPVAANYSEDRKLSWYNSSGRVEMEITPNKGEFVRALWAYVPIPVGETPKVDPSADIPRPCSFSGTADDHAAGADHVGGRR